MSPDRLVPVDLGDLREPIIVAPMAGGPSCPALVVAAGQAGGLGMLAAGYKQPSAVRAEIAEVRSLTDAPFGVNVFVPAAAPVDTARLERYISELASQTERYGVRLGVPVDDDDQFDAKVDMLCDDPVPVVSFAFGQPPPDTVAALRARGTRVLVTVNTVDEADRAVAAGADALVVQGIEAGAHQGGAGDTPGAEGFGLLALLRLISSRTDVPLVAAGGIADGAAVAAVLAAGAIAAQVGTAFLRCPEAGTNPVHRAEIGGARQTVVTRAFTGRRARTLVNDFATRWAEKDVPSAYPQIHHVTTPLRREALADGDPERVPLWAGQTHHLAREAPAGDLIRRLGAEARQALWSTSRRLGPPAP
jgi:nitronate monooxygenase